jgi:hypothetical protein
MSPEHLRILCPLLTTGSSPITERPARVKKPAPPHIIEIALDTGGEAVFYDLLQHDANSTWLNSDSGQRL